MRVWMLLSNTEVERLNVHRPRSGEGMCAAGICWKGDGRMDVAM